MTRVATAETEGAWLEATERRTVREVEAMVSGRTCSDLPSGAKGPLLVPGRMVFELEPEQFALVVEAFEKDSSRDQIRLRRASSLASATNFAGSALLIGTPETLFAEKSLGSSSPPTE